MRATPAAAGRRPGVQTVRVLGACLVGTGAELVTVEARFDGSLKERTDVVITGLPDTVIRESRGRLVCALEANGLHLPQGRLFLNLVPAARRKTGETLDLPLALGAAAACGHLERRSLRKALFVGELGIDGTLHAVPGGLAAALVAKGCGVPRFFAPPPTAAEAAWIPGVASYAVRHLGEVIAHLAGAEPALQPLSPPELEPARERGADLDQVRGQAFAKQALAAAAAGGHGLLFVGPPGVGKSMLARRLPSLLAPPTLEERLEITRVLSAAGRWPGGLARERPFRAPHPTVSYAGLVGGGSPPAPGEITLAHCGVLFLDELPEFRRETLEALRQPLEDGSILLSRAGRQIELPARFQLVAAMNPCPCGYLGHPRVPCPCPPSLVQRYRRRISGPLLDRIDLRVELAPPALDELASPPGNRSRAAVAHGPNGADLRARAERALARQHARQGPLRNASLTGDALDALVPLDPAGRRLLAAAVRRHGLSARALQSVRRVARTLADLDDREVVGVEHLAQGLSMRASL